MCRADVYIPGNDNLEAVAEAAGEIGIYGYSRMMDYILSWLVGVMGAAGSFCYDQHPMNESIRGQQELLTARSQMTDSEMDRIIC